MIEELRQLGRHLRSELDRAAEATTAWSPRLYDLYFRHLTREGQGSLPRRLAVVPTPGPDAPHALVFSFRYWGTHAAWELAFAKELQRHGYRVTVVGCDRAVDTCDNMYYGAETQALNLRCGWCSKLLRSLCARAGVEYVSIREHLNARGLRDSAPAVPRDYRALVRASWTRLIRSTRARERGELALRDALEESCRLVDAFLTDYLATTRVDRAVMLNGKFFAEQLLSEHCRERGIPFVSYERGVRAETVMFAQDAPAIPPATAQRWAARRDRPLTDEERDRLHAYLDSRKVRGNDEQVPFYTSLTESRDALRRELDLDPARRLVVLFTNSVWDSTVIDEDTLFPSMFDWISACIRHYADDPETTLLIRVHPVEVKVHPYQRTRERVDDYVRAVHGAPEHVRVVPPESDASPYALMEMADLGLVYTSTTGMEMALRGKPVIVAANTHFAGTELVHTPPDREAFLALLADPPGPRPGQVTWAERYAYMYYFEHLVPTGDVVCKAPRNYAFVGDPTRSRILEQAGLL